MVAAANGLVCGASAQILRLMQLEQHQAEIEQNLGYWQRKPLLQRIYAGFYSRIIQLIDPQVTGAVVEIGSGIGNLKAYYPAAICSDLFPNPWLDLVCDGYDLPFARASLSHLTLFDVFHHLEAPATAARYPNALVVGPKSAQARNPRVSLTMGTDDPAYIHSTLELTPVQLRGVPFLDETVFFHPASGSLIAADLLMSACARDHWTWRIAARIWGRYEKVGTPPDVRMHTRASTAVAESIAQMRALPLQRILVAHADPITDRPAQQLAEAWDFAIGSYAG